MQQVRWNCALESFVLVSERVRLLGGAWASFPGSHFISCYNEHPVNVFASWARKLGCRQFCLDSGDGVESPFVTSYMDIEH